MLDIFLALLMASEDTQLFEDKLALIRCVPQLKKLRRTGELSDLTIQLQHGVRISVHRVVLVSRVPALHDSVCGTLKDDQAVLQWPLVSSEVAGSLLDYIYTGQLEVRETNVVGLMVLSQQLLLPHLEDWLVSFMAARLNPENIATCWDLAQLRNNNQLKDTCLQHIKRTFEATVATDFFVNLPSDAALSLLQADDLLVHNEESVFEAIKRWVSPLGEVDETRLVHAEAMMREVRWDQVDSDFRCRLFIDEGFWNKSLECLQLLDHIAGWIESSSSREDIKCPFNAERRRPFSTIYFIGQRAWTTEFSLFRYDTIAGTAKQLTTAHGGKIVAVEGKS
ncbi:unnamed protein product [Dibothriocephalus latus]|uniref:BTB domain-containing protein n=1 Tax=Dibothriocephalus latus TaxID=60516 RepID=A0A3P6R180_DIBLA|nr:unnamed protein product [Dibothriocephalus latus]